MSSSPARSLAATALSYLPGGTFPTKPGALVSGTQISTGRRPAAAFASDTGPFAWATRPARLVSPGMKSHFASFAPRVLSLQLGKTVETSGACTMRGAGDFLRWRCSEKTCNMRTIRKQSSRTEGNNARRGAVRRHRGLELGLRDAGHETIFVSENWTPAAAVLEVRFPGIPNAGDVTTLKALPTVDLLTAGFPCQDLSQAGKTAESEGKKSGLVDQVFRLIDGNRPDWVLLENVSFMLRLDRGSAMDRLVSAFEERGYRWAYRVVNSLSFVPQRRERVFFLASLEGDPADILFVDDVEPNSPITTLESRRTRVLLDGREPEVSGGALIVFRLSKTVPQLVSRRRPPFCFRTAKS